MREETVIITEGVADDALFKELLAVHALTNLCVYSPKNPNDYSNGKFKVRLEGLKATTSLRVREKKCIIIVADNDDDPNALFKLVRDQIRDAGEYRIPQAECEVFGQLPVPPDGDLPPVSVLTIPWAKTKGSIDSMCWEVAAKSKQGVATCVNNFAGCIPATEATWGITNFHKLKMRCMLSATCPTNPYTVLKLAWPSTAGDGRPIDLIPVTDPVFAKIVTYLRTFQ